jgi:hypothetical protein
MDGRTWWPSRFPSGGLQRSDGASGVGGLSSGVVVSGEICEGWWLVVDDENGRCRAVAGPVPERAEAVWAAAGQHAGAEPAVRPAYGIRRDDGTLNRRPSPQDWAWLAHLGSELDRLPEDWDVALEEDDPLVTLIVEVTAALAEAGLPLHDATGPESSLGGACLTPEPALGGILVTWRQHDRMSVDLVHGAAPDTAVQQVMNRALADVLRMRCFAVEPFGEAGGSVVRPVR